MLRRGNNAGANIFEREAERGAAEGIELSPPLTQYEARMIDTRAEYARNEKV